MEAIGGPDGRISSQRRLSTSSEALRLVLTQSCVPGPSARGTSHERSFDRIEQLAPGEVAEIDSDPRLAILTI
jgi:hypothetical protein